MCFLLLEDGGEILLETGGGILLNQIPEVAVAPNLPGTVIFDSVNADSPAVEIMYSAGKGYFQWPGYTSASRVAQPPISPSASYAGLLGYWKMPNQLLLIPGSGFLSREIYTVYASGYAIVPVNAPADVQFNILMEQNAFLPGPDNSFDSIIHYQDSLATLGTPVDILPGTLVTWALIARLTGGGQNEGYVSSQFTLSVGDDCGNPIQTYSGGLASVRGRSAPRIQLSMAVQCSGGIDLTHPLKVKMTQFLLRRGVR